ncbi:quinic acid utilization activator [Ophiostoma piceae UAMH 11346]|uniref:Quinic acid utilization activator n=1 Tax=Ophiostoma piceae (strain UAMH 11346) TaxID=1262450 RepID=S3BQ07_OPHP1|nr:quinic acid utilization activator [Ophiostoma piceae UAMH 11346]
MAARGPRADAGQNSAAMSGTGATPAASTASTSRGAAGGKAATAPAKRQRVSRACDQCRAMREKCDGTQPQCSSCVAQNRPCTYKTSPKKRGVQTGYIRTMELTLSLLLDEVPGCAEALDRLFSRQGEAQRLFNPETGGQQDLERHNKLHRRWNKSRARREINRILSADGTSGSQAMSDRGSDDGTDTEVGHRAGASALLSLNRPPTSAAWSPSEYTNPSPITAGNTDDGSTATTSRSVLALPPNHRHLLDIYFSYTHCWFPILERRDLLKTAHHCEREALDPTSGSATALSESSAVAELWAVMALASYQNAASLGSPGAAGTGAQSGRESLRKPQHIYKMARRIIPSDDGPFEIQHARALLILALINIGQRTYTAARMQVSMARQVAEESSSRSNPQPALPRSDHKIADAVLVGCCILDAMSAIVRTASAHAGSGLATAPSAATPSVHATHFCMASVPEDGLDEWQTWAPCLGFSAENDLAERGPAYSLSTFNQLHNLMRVIQQQLAAALNDSPRSRFISPANFTTSDQYTLDTRALDQAIRYDLPSSSFIRANSQAAASVPSAYVVRIAFIWAHIVLSSKRGASGVTQSLIFTLADIVEQFIIRFGAAATPPFLVPIVLSVVESPDFVSSQRIVQQRWHVLVDVIESTWNRCPSRDTAGRPQPGDHIIGIGGPVPSGIAPLQSPDTRRASPVPGQYVQQYQTAPSIQHSSATGYAPAAVAHGYGYHQTTVSPHVQAHPITAASTSASATGRLSSERNAYQIPALPTSHPTAAYTSNGPPPSSVKQNDSPPPSGVIYTDTRSDHTLVQPNLPPPRPQQIQPITPNTVGNIGFGALPAATQLPMDTSFSSGMDYDSLLDDLASTDYLERLDADIGAQFMANLGYAPGSDNLGAVMEEYSGL